MKTFGMILSLFSLAPALCVADNFPTAERVNYVLFCMEDIGGQSFENLHTCSCRIDLISEKMLFAEYEEATTFERYRRMPGKKGGVVRDSDRAVELSSKLKSVGEKVNQQCKKVIHIGRTPPQV